jgi:hypothetical protein
MKWIGKRFTTVKKIKEIPPKKKSLVKLRGTKKMMK